MNVQGRKSASHKLLFSRIVAAQWVRDMAQALGPARGPEAQVQDPDAAADIAAADTAGPASSSAVAASATATAAASAAEVAPAAAAAAPDSTAAAQPPRKKTKTEQAAAREQREKALKGLTSGLFMPNSATQSASRGAAARFDWFKTATKRVDVEAAREQWDAAGKSDAFPLFHTNNKNPFIFKQCVFPLSTDAELSACAATVSLCLLNMLLITCELSALSAGLHVPLATN